MAFPENFHLLAITNTKQGLVYETGHSLGVGDVRHVPLRWPVDSAMPLQDRQWDQRLEMACGLLAADPGKHATSAVALAAGVAADLANAAMERRSQKVENVATGVRTYVLMGTAYEALHCKGSTAQHSHAEVIKGIGRLDPGSTALGANVFSEQGIKRPPTPEPGSVATRPMLATAQLVYLRNTYAHGRLPADPYYKLPVALNETHVLQAATLILAALIGYDLLRDLACVLSDSLPEAIGQEAKHGVPFARLHSAFMDWGMLLGYLEEAIVPPENRLEKDGDDDA